MKKVFNWYLNISLVVRILVALVAGAIIGLLVGPSIAVIEILGSLMMRLLQMIVLPLIFFAIVMGVGAMPISKTGRAAGKIMVYYVFTTICAASMATLIANIFKPGLGMSFGTADSGVGVASMDTPAISDFILNMIPSNIVHSFAEGSYLQVLVFSVFFGFAISVLRDNKDEKIRNSVLAMYGFCEGGAEIMFAMTKAVLEFTPIGVFALISVTFANEGLGFLGSAASIIGCTYLGYAFQICVVYTIALMFVKINPLQFFSKARGVMLMAFSTRSSSSTLPLSMKTSEESMGIPKNIGGFTLPLGSQINLDGEAFYQVIAVFTIAFASGLQLTLMQQIMLVFVVTIGGTGTAGIAGSGPVILLGVIGMLGLDVSAGSVGGAVFAVVLGIDVILDMGRTMTNVTGDLTGTCVVAKSEGLMDMTKWDDSIKVKRMEAK